MKKLKHFNLLLLFCFLAPHFSFANENLELPSEQSEKSLNELPSNTYKRPIGRMGPGEGEDGEGGEDAQKETPLEHDLLTFLLLAAGVAVYQFSKKRRHSKKTRLSIVIFCLFSAGSYAQNTFKAHPDNYFVKPGETGNTILEVLTNDFYGDDCLRKDLEMSITVQPTYGQASFDAQKRLVYRIRPQYVNPIFAGQDKLTYQVKCGTKTATATVYININDKPNTISDADCYVDPVGIPWGIKEIARSSQAQGFVSTLSNVLAGDIDGDGEIELLTFNMPPVGTGTMSTAILIHGFKKATQSLYLKYTIALPRPHYPIAYGTYAIANVDGNQYASIYYTTNANTGAAATGTDLLLLKYSYDIGSKTFKESWRRTVTTNSDYGSAVPRIADLMSNGHQQVCILDKVYDAKTGTLLANGNLIPTTGRVAYSFGQGGHDVYTSLLNTADIDGDGIQEIIGGDCVYKVNLTNYTGIAGNTFTLLRRAIKGPRSDIFSGRTAVADIDLDGYLDVIVTCKPGNERIVGTNGYLYVYNPRTGVIMNSNTISLPQNIGPSDPFVGDLTGDGRPEIALSAYLTLRAYKYKPTNATTGILEEMWNLPTTDGSAATTLSLFDFTQSGKAQLIYRDETTLRIIDGETGSALSTISGVQSATTNEYPIVVDVNGDGAAEIVVTGVDDMTTARNWTGEVRVYAANSIAGGKKWAPARPVWNQIGYNPLYVNDDLTIPARPLNPVTAFSKADGTFDRPFNNFLQQSTSLNREGTMIMLGPDLAFDPSVPKKLKFNTDNNTLNVTVGIINQGDAPFLGPIEFQLYTHSQPSTYTKIGSVYVQANTSLSNVSPNNKLLVTYTISNVSSFFPATYDDFAITMNLTTNPSQTPVFKGAKECHDGWNNRTSGLSLVDGARVMCEGETATLKANPINIYHLKWYDAAVGGNLVHTGDTHTITKNADDVTLFFIEAYQTPTSLSPITSIRDTIFAYKACDSLVWTGKAGNQDWNDYQNWENPHRILYPAANIPRACTNVLLPSAVLNYPNLTSKATSGATNYVEYTKAVCNNVSFAHGGELQTPDLLVYNKAYVDVTLDSHRWYMFGFPLKDFYTGDIYMNNKAPVHDPVKIYTRFFARQNPQYWTFYEADWTGTFYYPNQTFKAGEGFGVWVSDKLNHVKPYPQDPFHFSFPKHDSNHHSYIKNTDIVDETYPLVRGNENRFIFDGLAPAGQNFNLEIPAYKTGDLVLIANPFMAHIDFDKFYAANAGKINRTYYVLDKTGNIQSYNMDAPTGILGRYIPPMQAFFISSKTPFTHLVANGNMTTTTPGNKLKAIQAEEPFYLKVDARQGAYKAESYILFDNRYTENYNQEEDVISLFENKTTSIEPLSLYTTSEEGIKVQINAIPFSSLSNKTIPIGFRTPSKENVSINIGNLSSFPSDVSIYLYDQAEDKYYDVRANSMQEFEAVTLGDNLFVDNRFYLKFGRTITGLETITPQKTEVYASAKDGLLELNCEQQIKEIRVYSVQGQQIGFSKPNLNRTSIQLPNQTLYIVHVITDKGAKILKVSNR